MREVINAMAEKQIESIWAVHDSFGTHAADIENMREIIKEEFYKIHQNRTINWWCKQMNPNWKDYEIVSVLQVYRKMKRGEINDWFKKQKPDGESLCYSDFKKKNELIGYMLEKDIKPPGFKPKISMEFDWEKFEIKDVLESEFIVG